MYGILITWTVYFGTAFPESAVIIIFGLKYLLEKLSVTELTRSVKGCSAVLSLTD